MSTDQTPTPSTTTTGTSSPTNSLPFTVPPSLQPFLIPAATWLAANPPFKNLAIGGLIFHSSSLLLIQRAASDAFPHVWEYPGGACEPLPIDATILHSVAREVHEETGLTVTGFVRQVGGTHSWPEKTGLPRWAKLSFEVEVREMRGGVEMGERERKGLEKGGERERKGLEKGGEEGERVCAVRLDAEEHQRYLWVTEGEVRSGEVDGERIEVMDEPNRRLILAGFEGRRAGEGKGE